MNYLMLIEKNSEPQAIEMLRSTGVQLMVSPFGRTCAVLLMVGGIGGIGKIVFAGLQEFSGNIVPMAIFLSCGIVGYALWVGKKWSVFIARILFGLQIPIINSDLFRYNFFQERVLIF